MSARHLSTTRHPHWLPALRFLLPCLLTAAQRIDAGITAHYPLENNLDETAGIDTRPVVRGTLAYGSAAVGRAVMVPGDDEIDCGGIPASTFAGDFTIAWFMDFHGDDAHRLFSKESTCIDSANPFFAAVDARSPARLSVYLSRTSARATAIASVPRKQSVHVALVRNGSVAKVYSVAIVHVIGPAKFPTARPSVVA